MKFKKIFFAGLSSIFLALALVNNSCSVRYGFNDVSIPDTIHTIKVNLIENRAPYNNPQLGPQLSDKLRQKILSQTKLKQTNGDNPDWEISATITDYSFSTSGVSNGQSSTNRISVAVHIILNKIKNGTVEENDVSRNFEFPSTQTLQQAESSLLPEMIRSLSDDIFNRVFSSWDKQ